jgi:hypothetical protein
MSAPLASALWVRFQRFIDKGLCGGVAFEAILSLRMALFRPK